MSFLPDFGATRVNIDAFRGVGPCCGTFQATAAATSTVSDSNVPANSTIVFWPMNAAAGLLERTKTCSIATGNSAGSFVFSVSATGAGAPGGSETFGYFCCIRDP